MLTNEQLKEIEQRWAGLINSDVSALLADNRLLRKMLGMACKIIGEQNGCPAYTARGINNIGKCCITCRRLEMTDIDFPKCWQRYFESEAQKDG